MHKSKLITFIIPTCGRPELLEKCTTSLNSALMALGQQDLSDFRFQVKIIFNGESTRQLRTSSLLQLTSFSTEKLRPSEARNRAVQQTESDYYYFIDDDTQIPEGFLGKVCQIIRQYPDAVIFGGPDTCSPDVSIFEHSLELALRSPLTTQKTNKRHTPKTQLKAEQGSERNLILCNLCVQAKVFSEFNCYFPIDYQRNEENVFLAQLDGKVKILYFANLFIYHKRRSALRNVYFAASRSGFYRSRMIRDGYGRHQFVFLVPTIFLIYLISLLFASLWFNLGPLWIPLMMYVILNILSSFRICLKSNSLNCLLLVIGYQIFITLSYGLGVLAGIGQKSSRQKIR